MSDLAATPAPTIALNEIPDDWRVPGVNLEVRPRYTNKGLAALPTRVLIAGIGATLTPAAANKPIQITRAGQGAALFGAGSPLGGAVEAFVRANPFTSLWAVEATSALASAGAAARALGKVVIGGAATQPGPLPLAIAGWRVTVPAYPTDTPTALAAELAAAINAIPAMPVSVVADPATPGGLLLTAKFYGLEGNAIDLRTALRAEDAVPPGLTCAITPMSGGTGTSDLAPILAGIANQWFTDIVLVMTDAANIATLTAELARRYGAMGKRDCHGWIGYRGSYTGLIAANPLLGNSQFLTAIGASNMPTPPWELAGALAGVATFALTQDPSRQLRGLVLPGVIPPAGADCFVESERDQLLRNGWSTFERVNGQVVLERVITAYTTSALGAADTAWLDVMVPKTATRIRYDWRQFALLNWPRCKLAPDGSTAEIYDADGVVVTPRRVHNSWGARCKLYAQAGWIVNESETVAASIFEIDPNDKNRLKTQLAIDIVGNLMRLDGALEFAA